jgi:hypothetical protein
VVMWAPAAAGILVWALSLAEAFEPVPEVVTTVAGSLLVAGALFANGHWTRHAEEDSDCRCGA